MTAPLNTLPPTSPRFGEVTRYGHPQMRQAADRFYALREAGQEAALVTLMDKVHTTDTFLATGQEAKAIQAIETNLNAQKTASPETMWESPPQGVTHPSLRQLMLMRDKGLEIVEVLKKGVGVTAFDAYANFDRPMNMVVEHTGLSQGGMSGLEMLPESQLYKKMREALNI